MDNKLIDFDGLDAIMHKAGLEMMPAEAHGILCGLCCQPELPQVDIWLREVLQAADRNNVLVQEAITTLTELYDATLEQISLGEFALDVLLPDDETDLDQRLLSLSEWCQGFYMGISMLGLLEDTQELPENSREFVDDVIEISRADQYRHSKSETDEASYAEVVEYLRVGAMLMITELQQAEV